MARARSLRVVKSEASLKLDVNPIPPALSQTELAVSVIRDRIIDLTLEPGSKLDERLLMERFKLGRTPAREALNRLSTEGFVKIERNKGAFVAPLEISHVRQFFDAYFASERMCGYYCRTGQTGLLEDLVAIEATYEKYMDAKEYLGITGANADFHTRISEGCENEHIQEFGARLHQQARRLSHVIYCLEQVKDDERVRLRRKIRQHHRAIIEAIEAGDNAELMQQLTTHAQLFHDRIMRVIRDAKGLDLSFVRPVAGRPRGSDTGRLPNWTP